MKNKSIEQLKFIEAVQERDIDLLLLEELSASAEFREWFVKQSTEEEIDKFVGVWHSISAPKSEFDIVLIFISKSGKKYALFIEDKVGAIAQKNQPQRYSLRGEEGIVKKEWDASKTCIIAPERYLQTNKEAKEYQSQISYELIGEWFLKNQSERHNYKYCLVKEAIEQNRRGYNKIVHEKTTSFWQEYYQHANKNFPELEMKEPTPKSEGESWVYFCPAKLKNKMEIVHKGRHGFVDLQFNKYGDKLEELEQKLKLFMKRNMELVKTGKSVSLRVIVPKIDSTLEFERQEEGINKGLKVAKRLLKIGVLVANKI